MPTRPKSPFGVWLLGELRERGLLQRDLSRTLGVHHSAVYQWTTGVRPEPAHCEGIARALGLPFGFVLEQAGHLGPPPDQVDLRDRAKVLINLVPRESLPVLIAMLEGLRADRAVVVRGLVELVERPRELVDDARDDAGQHHDREPDERAGDEQGGE